MGYFGDQHQPLQFYGNCSKSLFFVDNISSKPNRKIRVGNPSTIQYSTSITQTHQAYAAYLFCMPSRCMESHTRTHTPSNLACLRLHYARCYKCLSSVSLCLQISSSGIDASNKYTANSRTDPSKSVPLSQWLRFSNSPAANTDNKRDRRRRCRQHGEESKRACEKVREKQQHSISPSNSSSSSSSNSNAAPYTFTTHRSTAHSLILAFHVYATPSTGSPLPSFMSDSARYGCHSFIQRSTFNCGAKIENNRNRVLFTAFVHENRPNPNKEIHQQNRIRVYLNICSSDSMK